MNREEFVEKINASIEELEAKKTDLSSNLEFMTAVMGEGSEDVKTIKTQINDINEEIESMKKMIGFSAFLRIDTMSDIEAEEYKKEQIAEKEKELEKMKPDVESKEREKNELERQKNTLMKEFSQATPDKKTQIIEQAKQIQSRIEELATVDTSLVDTSEIERIKSEIEIIKAKKTSDIIEEEKEKFAKRMEYEAMLVDYKRQVTKEDRMYASLAEDPERLDKFIKFALEYGDKHRSAISLLGNPAELSWSDFSPVPRGINLWSPYPFEDTISRTKEKQGEIAEIWNECTPEKIKSLIYYIERKYKAPFTDSDSVSERIIKPFLEKFTDLVLLHSNKFAEEDVAEIREKVDEIEKLESKRFKTKDTKNEIETKKRDLSKILKERLDVLCKYYEKKFHDYAPMDYTRGGNDVYKIERFFSGWWPEEDDYEDKKGMIDNFISDEQRKLNELEYKLLETKSSFEKKEKDYQAAIDGIQKEFAEIVGPEFAGVEYPYEVKNEYYGDSNREYIISQAIKERVEKAKAKVTKQETIRPVYEAAKVSSDEKEADLRGMTLEELIKYRTEVMEAKEKEEQSGPKF